MRLRSGLGLILCIVSSDVLNQQFSYSLGGGIVCILLAFILQLADSAHWLEDRRVTYTLLGGELN